MGYSLCRSRLVRDMLVQKPCGFDVSSAERL